MFLKNSIERILHEPAIKKSANAELKKACETALEQLKTEVEERAENGNSGGVLPNFQEYILADRYFLPFDLACRSSSPKIVVIALDCIQKLVVYGHLVGNAPDPIDPDKKLVDRIIDAVCKPFDGPNTDENVELQIIKVLLAMLLSSTSQVHESSLLTAVRTCFNICLATKNATNCSTARATLTQIITRVFEKMEEVEQDGDYGFHENIDDVIVKSTLDSIVNQVVLAEEAEKPEAEQRSIKSMEDSINNNQSTMEFKSVEEKDAFLILRAFCVLCEKHAGNSEHQSHELNSLHLSLEMILLILQKSKVTYSEKHSFVYVLRHFLCKALSKNASSSVISVFEKSLAIVVELINKFKVHLKPQIEVFFNSVILHFLESNTSDFEHKWIALNTVSKICDDPQSVVDIYVNYDCGMTSANIFHQLIELLSKLTKSTPINPHAAQGAKEKERHLRELSLHCLVKVLRCLDWWHENMSRAQEDDSTSRLGDSATEGEDALSTANSFNAIQQFEQRKQQKSIIEHGLELFAKKPKRGLGFLQEKEIIGTTVQDIATFLFHEERLPKEAVGDYIGEGDEFNKSVMLAYVDLFNFDGLSVVSALRRFLEKFKLPGEAQKIDRLVEKFSSRYCECNPNLNIFASADTVYVLSYSIVMLTTDLHNPQVKTKITVPDYIKMNRGINNGADLPEELLVEIYNDISTKQIKVNPDSNRKKLNVDVVNATYRQLKLIQKNEFELISQNAHTLMEAATSLPAEYTTATHFEHVRLIFENIWQPCYAAFSIGLQSSDEHDIWAQCLDGFRYSIRVACVFNMKNERDVFVDALKKFTKLATKNLSDMKAKNVEAIKLLITVGDENGDFLEERWFDVIDCISQLEIAQQLGSGKNPDDLRRALNVTDKSLNTLQECLDETSSQSVVVAVDKIFQNSSKLTGEAIVHFVDALCTVARSELAIPGAPRMYMLQKIVEISFYNMGRIRIEWSLIWKKLGELFNTAGVSSNETISQFALDALRQLSTKFLEKGELPNFSFQKEFLRPFELIMERSQSQARRELIIQIIGNMVQSHADRIRSGWKNIFSVCAIAALDPRVDIVEAAFKITSDIVTNVFPKHFVELLDSFQEAIKCLSEFAGNNDFADTSMESISLIKHAATLVAQNADLINEHRSDEDINLETHKQESQKVWMKGWLPIIFELSRVINRSKLDVRSKSLTVMFEIVRTYGGEFRLEWWTDLFQVVFRIFDFDKLNQLGSEKDDWMETTCHQALYYVNNVFTSYFIQLAPTLLKVYFRQLLACVNNGSGNLAPNAIQCFSLLVTDNGKDFTPEMWEDTLKFIQSAFESSVPDFEKTDPHIVESVRNQVPSNPDSTMPNGIQPTKSAESSPVAHNNFISSESSQTINNSSLLRCHVQLQLVESIGTMLFGPDTYKVESPNPKEKLNGINGVNGTSEEQPPGCYSSIPSPVLLKIVHVMWSAHKSIRLFRTDEFQRNVLFKATMKCKDVKSKPNANKLETLSVHTTLNILHRLYSGATDPKEIEVYRKELVDRKAQIWARAAILSTGTRFKQ